MRKPLIVLLLVVLITSCLKKPEIVLVNNSAQKMSDYPVLLTRSEFEKLVGELPEDKIPVLYDQEGQTIPYQLDDMDQDTVWDEIAFVYSLPAQAEVTMYVSFVDSGEVPSFEPRTNIRFAMKSNLEKELDKSIRLMTTDNKITQNKFQMEGPAWENDKVGFRNYFDERNGMDIFGKTTEKMVLDKVGIKGQNYHELDDWGMDILKVGNSLGAGAIALMVDDSLIRVGPDCKGLFHRIVDGPVRSVFKLTYQDLKFKDQAFNIVHNIILWAGQYGYHAKVEIEGMKDADKFIVGIVNKQSDSLYLNKSEHYVSLLTYDKQAINNDKLGMGLIIPKQYYLEECRAPATGKGIVQTYYAMMYIPIGQPLEYWFYAGWERSNEMFGSREGFMNYLKEQVAIKSADVGILKVK